MPACRDINRSSGAHWRLTKDHYSQWSFLLPLISVCKALCVQISITRILHVASAHLLCALFFFSLKRDDSMNIGNDVIKNICELALCFNNHLYFVIVCLQNTGSKSLVSTQPHDFKIKHVYFLAFIHKHIEKNCAVHSYTCISL